MAPWTVAQQAPLSMGLSRQEYWSGLPCPSSGDLPSPGTKPRCPTLQADSLPSEPPGKPIDHGGGFYFNPNVRRCIEVLIWRTEVSYISYAFAVAVVLFCFFVLGFFFLEGCI